MLGSFFSALKAIYTTDRVAALLYGEPVITPGVPAQANSSNPERQEAERVPKGPGVASGSEAHGTAGTPVPGSDQVTDIKRYREQREAKRRQLLRELDVSSADRIATLKGGF